MRLCLAALLVCSISAAAQVPAPTPQEARAARAFEAAKKAGAPQLHAFLKPFPKGADLHMHLSGAIYAETFIAEAVQQGLCVGPVDSAAAPGMPAVPTPQGVVKFVSPVTVDGKPGCPAGATPASSALANQKLYDALIDSFSMRAFVPAFGISGHDQFFVTFDRFGGLKNFSGAWLDEVATRAATQNEQYLEIMSTPSFDHASAAANKAGWPADFNDANHMAVLATLRDQLFAAGLRDDIAIDTKEVADAQATRKSIEHCGDTAALPPSPCNVQIHILYQVLRGFPPQQVFAQTLLGFELASANPDVVGINFVRAEDRRDAMAEYHTEMLMLDYLHSVYPKVHISLHAGELAPGMVTPAGLPSTFAKPSNSATPSASATASTSSTKTAPTSCLKRWRKNTSTSRSISPPTTASSASRAATIRSAAYRAARVPFSLSTDDEGVSRGNLTQEYVRGAIEQNLTYANLKQSARSSLEHSFLPGESLYVATDDFVRRKPACAAAITATSKPTATCEKLLGSSERAAQQYELERRFAAFESSSF